MGEYISCGERSCIVKIQLCTLRGRKRNSLNPAGKSPPILLAQRTHLSFPQAEPVFVPSLPTLKISPPLILPPSLSDYLFFLLPSPEASYRHLHPTPRHIPLLEGWAQASSPLASPVRVIEGICWMGTSFFSVIKHLKDWCIFIAPLSVLLCPPLPP